VIRPEDATDARAYLGSLELFGVKLGLDTIRAIARELGSPERAYRSVHIGGTNGKGSIAAIVDTALRAAGHRCGRYTSPHLVRLEERFHVDGKQVEPSALDEAIERVRSVVAGLVARGDLAVHPTFFEVTTAAAFELFERARVTVAVLEVGLGGRFDATNIVVPDVSCIASIAFDHEQYLGGTLASIAFEKAGIIKRGVPVVIGALPADARAVVRQRCDEVGAPLIDAQAGSHLRTSYEGGWTELELTTAVRTYPRVRLALRGAHQVQNALVAVRVLETLDMAGLRVPSEALVAGLTSAHWPARLDLRALPDGRQVLIDGAHNPEGARALAEYVRREWPERLPYVVAAMADKDFEGLFHAFAPTVRQLIVTRVPGRRSADPDRLAAAALRAGITHVECEPEIPQALSRAWRHGPLVVVAGSIYLAGRVLEWLDCDRRTSVGS
jgi:dihydrofolate synthase/folylpolyglutamate synthase